MEAMQFKIDSLQEMMLFARACATKAQKGEVFALSGDLGVGKTTFVRFFVQHLSNPAQEVTSPTFSLVHIYDTSLCPIWHLDLYRLESVQEVVMLGIEEAMESSIMLIEWPEIATPFLPLECFNLEFLWGEEENSRYISCTGPKEWKKLYE